MAGRALRVDAALSGMSPGTSVITTAGVVCLVAAAILSSDPRAATIVSAVDGLGQAAFLALCAMAFCLICTMTALGFAAMRERKARQDLEAKLIAAHQSGFDAASDAIVVLDLEGRIETFNKAAERMFGQSRDSLKGQDVTALLGMASPSGPLPERLQTTIADLSSGIHMELSGKRQNGESFPAEITFRELQQIVGSRIVAFVRDISGRKRIEKLKDEFVSTVNHELRTPLTSIAGSLGLLAGGAAGELPSGAARLIGIAHANCQRLIRLINDVLDVEKIESGNMRFDMTLLQSSEVVARAVESLQGYADELGVHIECRPGDDDVSVRADADRLVQVLTNLISNALKFSAAGGCVAVSVMKTGNVARVCVKDDGPGIPDEFRSRIFTKFAQADSSDTRQKGGTGLGLVIAKEIVERHGGRLWFESEAGKGARFYADLPLAAEEAVGSAHAQGKPILLCEDDFDLAAVLCKMLEQDGHAVKHVASKADALRELTRFPIAFSAVLLDLVLPDGDGVELIREMRDRDETRHLPVIVVSADAERGRKEIGASALNVVDWMGKPVDSSRLIAAVRRAAVSAARLRPLILHVEDDPDILQITSVVLRECGQVISVESLGAAREALVHHRPDLVILDLGLGDGSGLELLPDLHDGNARLIPVLVFSAKDTDQALLDRVAAVMTKSKSTMPQLAKMVSMLLDDNKPAETPPQQAVA